MGLRRRTGCRTAKRCKLKRYALHADYGRWQSGLARPAGAGCAILGVRKVRTSTCLPGLQVLPVGPEVVLHLLDGAQALGDFKHFVDAWHQMRGPNEMGVGAMPPA